GKIGENPDGIPNNLLPYISQVAIGKRKKLYVFGNDYETHDGTGIRDYIHVVDLVRGHIKALEYLNNNTGIEAFNLGTGTGYSVLDIVRAFREVNNVEIPYEITTRRPGDIAISYANPKKAKRFLKWKAEYDLRTMCQDTWRWQSKNPNGFT
ncbi:MAG: GDP-mannose 4,6-dehydratase, partial [Caldibacillus thermoamylovorans]